METCRRRGWTRSASSPSFSTAHWTSAVSSMQSTARWPGWCRSTARAGWAWTRRPCCPPAISPASLTPSDHLTQIAANEFLDEDVNKFSDLARAPSPVGRLSEATGGTPARSKRFREVLVPHGFAHGDELRAVFIDGDAVWGCVAIHRQHGEFTSSEAQLVADLGAIIGEGIHRAVLLTALMTGPGPDLPGLILVRPDGSIESITPAAASLLAEIVDSTGRSPGLPLVVASLVAKARGTDRPRRARGQPLACPGRRGAGTCCTRRCSMGGRTAEWE